jgi:membrane fusion protein (multidrug efflux system)
MLPRRFFCVKLLLVSLGSLWLLSCSSDQGAGAAEGPGKARPPALVEVREVSFAEVSDEIEATGTLEANESVIVTSTVTDIVSSINFDDGQSVEKGEILLTLSNDEQSAELDEALANLNESKRQLSRLEGIGGSLASESDIDLARAQVDVNRGRLEAIKARLADRIVSAPFSGVLGIRKVSVGAVVGPNTEIARLDDISVLNLDFTVPEVYLGKLSAGAQVKAKSPAKPGTEFEGIVSFVDSRVDVATRAVQVRAKIPNPELELLPGMLMTVTLYARPREAMVIAESALKQVGERSYVFVLTEENSVERRQIQIDKRLPGQVVVSEGLTLGEKVVVDGTLSIRDGNTVRLLEQPDKKKEPEQTAANVAESQGV